jgi:microcystin-dependent protein
MTNFYLGEIQMFGFNFAPKNWALCNGQLMNIQQNTALFSLLGTTYGGNGTTTFQLPDLRGRLAQGQGQGPGLTNRVLGEVDGVEAYTLLVTETPQHNHSVNVISNPTLGNNTDAPGNTQLLAQTTYSGSAGAATNLYVQDNPTTNAMGALTIGSTGGQPHTNIMPTLVVNFCICLSGIFPSRN